MSFVGLTIGIVQKPVSSAFSFIVIAIPYTQFAYTMPPRDDITQRRLILQHVKTPANIIFDMTISLLKELETFLERISVNNLTFRQVPQPNLLKGPRS